MRYSAGGIKVPFQEDQDKAIDKSLARLGFPVECRKSVRIVKRSLDSRRKHEISFLYQLELESSQVLKGLSGDVKILEEENEEPVNPLPWSGPRPVVVGAGPAGLFAGLALAELGLNPLIIERGQTVEQRSRDVDAYWAGKGLDPESNMQFGEGGAGTFSDGKLTTRIQNRRIRKVFTELVAAGAPEEILYDYKPHIGTDLLVLIVAEIRKKIERLGGSFLFGRRLDDWTETDGRITSIQLSDGESLDISLLFLATGHSARDTYRLLERKAVAMQPKSFAVGTRIEHPQELINRMQYGSHWDDPRLPTASYSFTHNTRTGSDRRGVYTFCMCPGGEVVSSASEIGGTLVNGMSRSRRDGAYANSAVVVTVGPRDFGDGLMDGIEYQRKLEQSLFRAAEGYGSIFQRLDDFRAGRASRGQAASSFVMDLVPGSLHETLPAEIVEGLRSGFNGWSRASSFVHSSALLIGHETRTSSPLRILRGRNAVSESHSNLVPVGEGAGYAGGIVSAALDGLLAVESLCTQAALSK